jgi:hypothetical protein
MKSNNLKRCNFYDIDSWQLTVEINHDQDLDRDQYWDFFDVSYGLLRKKMCHDQDLESLFQPNFQDWSLESFK